MSLKAVRLEDDEAVYYPAGMYQFTKSSRDPLQLLHLAHGVRLGHGS